MKIRTNVRYSPLSCLSFASLCSRGKGNDDKILKSRDNKVLWGLAYILNLRGSLPLSLTPGINFRSKFFSIRFFGRIRANEKRRRRIEKKKTLNPLTRKIKFYDRYRLLITRNLIRCERNPYVIW